MEMNAIFPDIPAAVVNTTVKKNILLSPSEVESVLKILPVAKASGPDGLSNRILRELSKELSLPYCSLFNQSLRIGIIPSCCNEANVCPVPKKGDLSGISKCRSTQVLSSTQKIKFLKDLYSNIYVIIYVIIICFLRYNLYFCLATKPSIN